MKIEKILGPLTDEERELHATLDELKRAYETAAKPIIDRLVRIEALKPSRYVLVPEDGDIGMDELLPLAESKEG